MYETRVLGEKVELRAEAGKAPRLVGYASVFNSKSLDLGGFVEIVRPGAFSDSLKEGRDVVALVEHDMRALVGRKSAGTLAVGEDDRGLKVEIEPPDTQVGRDLVTNVRAGNLDAMSFGFRTRKDSWDVGKTPAVRELLSVELFDVSVVALPAYPKTEVAMRSLRHALRSVAGKPERREASDSAGAAEMLLEALEEWAMSEDPATTDESALAEAALEALEALDPEAADMVNEMLASEQDSERSRAARRRLKLRRAEAAVGEVRGVKRG